VQIHAPKRGRVLRSIAGLVVGAVLLAGCNGPAIPEAYLILGWPALDFHVPQGGESSLTVVVDRTPDYNKKIKVTARNLPPGATYTVNATTVDGTTTSVVTVHVPESVNLGKYFITLVVSGEGILDATRPVYLYVVEQPSYAMTVANPALSVARGGVAPFSVSFARTNFTEPVTLSVSGVAGISGSFAVNPVSANQAEGLLTIAGSVAPGLHTVTLRGVAPSVADRTVQLSVTVSAVDLQVLVDSAVSARQGATTRKSIVVNKSDAAGAVTVTAEGLPPGVTATLLPNGAHDYEMALAVLPSVSVGNHQVTIRATGNGVPDATANFLLTIALSKVAIVVAPETVSVFQGTTEGATLTLQRTALDTTVAITFEDAPAGITLTANPVSITGNSGAALVSVAADVAEGLYTATIVATPAGWGSIDATRKTLKVNVRAVPAGGGNVILDWGACTAPTWLAAQDGTNPWSQVVPAAGVFRFTVNSNRGGFAYRDPGDTLVVRFLTKAELTADAIDMCPPQIATKTLTGTAVPTSPNESATHNFGGAKATTTFTNTNFTLTGVQPGIHDFVSWAVLTPTGQRALIQRDVDLEDGSGFGAVENSGADSFLPIQASIFAAGVVLQEAVSHTMNFATTAACTVNQFYSTTALVATSTTSGNFMYGVPDAYRRPTDYHVVTVQSSSATRIRTTTVAFQRIETRTVSLITQSAVVNVFAQSGGHKRFLANVSNLNPAYNRSATMRYSGNGKSVRVEATIAYLAPTTFFTMVMPDLSAVAGWQSSFAPATNDLSSWNLTLDGATPGPVCSTAYQRVTLRHSGSF
jgi:hypothetical protein